MSPYTAKANCFEKNFNCYFYIGLRLFLVSGSIKWPFLSYIQGSIYLNKHVNKWAENQRAEERILIWIN